jgi:redox-sensitive bicupin YhaK (pirin superfamily)
MQTMSLGGHVLSLRRAADRGHFDHGWLDTFHTFSFAGYHDQAHMGFRALRVINEDRVAPGEGFGTHPHHDMEIITWVLDGTLAHRDSTGAAGALRHGDVQRMSAGTGVTHSEYNGSDGEPVHFLQIWILPDRAGHQPTYEQRPVPLDELRGILRPIASPDGADGSLAIHQDARVFATILKDDQGVRHALAPGRHAWVQVARGAGTVNGIPVSAGDGVALSGERQLELAAAGGEAEMLVFDLA